MTNYDLSKWLYEGACCGEFREMKTCKSTLIHSYYDYVESKANEPCYDDILIRVNGGEWREPLKESEE